MKLKTKIYTFCCLFLFIYSQHCSANSTIDIQLKNIISPFTRIASIHFSYTEHRSSLFFKQEQISTGEILFVKPDRVIKNIIKPSYKSYEINKEQLDIRLSQSTNNVSQSIDINDYPQLKRFIGLIKALFSGDSHFLQNNYNIKILQRQIKRQNIWHLGLTPKKTSITKYQDSVDIQQSDPVSIIEIQGKNEEIQSIFIKGFGGESSKMYINKIISISYH